VDSILSDFNHQGIYPHVDTLVIKGCPSSNYATYNLIFQGHQLSGCIQLTCS